MTVCQARLAQYTGGDANPYHVSLVAAYAATAADVAADDEHQHGAGYRSPWRDRAAGEFEAVCWFDGDAFWTRVGDASARKGPAPYDRLEEVVRPDGRPVPYRAGRHDAMNPQPVPPATSGR